ncbi:DMT family transporter [Phenylobacterium sp.]|uniref:DMT family transporter n=1 Tax=Phenylobacterium sp. TaxID=1871053 RepID=UPI002DED7629|nr:DMT family transporter [Phenylobacterium sp.]
MFRSSAEAALVALVIVAGALLPLQALINARLGGALGSPLWGAAAQNLIGALGMIAIIMALRPATPSLAAVGAVPAWAWLGGLMGMVYVFSVLVAAPALGAGRMMVCVIAGQMVCSIALDHFGVLHERRPINFSTLAGAVLLLAGAALVLRRE